MVVFMLLAADALEGDGPGPSLVRMTAGAVAACIPGVLHGFAQRYLNSMEANDDVLAFDADLEDLDNTFLRCPKKVLDVQ